MLDGLLYQDAPPIQEHYTDTHGYTDQVFGLCSILGYRFAPRLRDTETRRLRAASKKKTRQRLFAAAMCGGCNVDGNWDDFRERCQAALAELVEGRTEPFKELWSQEADVRRL